jgi:putative flippase GtrA
MSSRSWVKPSRFLIGSATSYVLVIGTTAVLHEGLHFPPSSAYAVGLVLAFGFNFFFNRHIVFESHESKGGPQALRFLATSGLFRFAEWLAFGLLSTWVTVHYVLVATTVQLMSLLLKYVVFRRFVFR